MSYSKKDAIILDCDEILLDHLGGFEKFVKKYYDIETVGRPVQYNLQDWLQCDNDRVMELLKNFNYYSYEFGLLEPVDQYVVSQLKKFRIKYPDVSLVVVTKSGTFGHSVVLRKVNLMNVFGDIFDDIIIIEQYQSKRGIYYKLKEQYNILTVVDDYLGNIDVAESLGLDTIVLECPHNKNVLKPNNEEYNIVPTWIEIYNYLVDKVESR